MNHTICVGMPTICVDAPFCGCVDCVAYFKQTTLSKKTPTFTVQQKSTPPEPKLLLPPPKTS